MPEVMKQLGDEHKNIARLLAAMEHQIAVFDAGEKPDYDVLAAIADYFLDFPDRCHHPKEDLVYRKICERRPDLAQTISDLEAEHEDISALARQFREAVENVLQDAEIARSAFDEIAHRFIEEQRRHMQMEDEKLFPLAQQVLAPEDWAEIDQRITREDDPLFGAAVTQEFAALRDRLLQWEAEDEALED